jgi:GT2 family glycosyltransferase
MASEPEPRVVSVILNTNRRQDTLDCLASLQAGTYPNTSAIVLDCQSTDGSVDAVRAEYPEARVIELTENLGYAGNNNVGLQAALQQGADWVFVLNEDTVVASDCLSRLVHVGESDSRIGIVGPMVYHHDEPAVIQSAGGELTRWWRGFHLEQNQADHGQLREPRQVRWISGCAILVRRAVIDAVGGIDPRFFIYWEETEWCVRAGQAGWRIVHVPAARVWHKGVQRDYRPKPLVTYYSTRNRLLFLAARGAPMGAWLVAWAEIGRTLASWSIRPKWRGKQEHRDAMARGVRDFIGHRWGRMVG